MKYKTMAEIETRKAAILAEMEQEGADLDALKKEMDELRENAQQIREAAAKAEETRKAVLFTRFRISFFSHAVLMMGSTSVGTGTWPPLVAFSLSRARHSRSSSVCR